MGGGGIPVINRDRSGVRVPTAAAYGTERKNPQAATGQNMGRNTFPSPAEWNRIGIKIPNPIKKPLNVIW